MALPTLTAAACPGPRTKRPLQQRRLFVCRHVQKGASFWFSLPRSAIEVFTPADIEHGIEIRPRCLERVPRRAVLVLRPRCRGCRDPKDPAKS